MAGIPGVVERLIFDQDVFHLRLRPGNGRLEHLVVSRNQGKMVLDRHCPGDLRHCGFRIGTVHGRLGLVSEGIGWVIPPPNGRGSAQQSVQDPLAGFRRSPICI